MRVSVFVRVCERERERPSFNFEAHFEIKMRASGRLRPYGYLYPFDWESVMCAVRMRCWWGLGNNLGFFPPTLGKCDFPPAWLGSYEHGPGP